MKRRRRWRRKRKDALEIKRRRGREGIKGVLITVGRSEGRLLIKRKNRWGEDELVRVEVRGGVLGDVTVV